jgi:hypothetical protein
VKAAATTELPGLRPHGAGGFSGSWGDGPWVIRVDPAAGAGGVLGDAPVVMTLSHPIEAASLTARGARAVRVWESLFPVPGHLALSPDGCVVIWIPQRPLRPGREHVLEVCGLRDLRGREVRPHRSSFTVGHGTLDDLLEDPGR